MKVSVTTLIGVAGLAASLTVGACATATNGDYTIFGKDTGINAANVQTDVNSALATACPTRLRSETSAEATRAPSSESVSSAET